MDRFDENSLTEFRIIEDGPIYVKGNFKLILSNGVIQQLQEVHLCRCGKSSNKPFCDNSHKK